ncbi:hypothetical protein [Glycomyces sp. NPDC047010]|uniref:hypothetical protein n=1 Tax=Glycomyces sp. NPDC047010 TaxID=3155023 RepID=UPI0033CD3F78
MTRPPKLDLKRDAKRVLQENWLHPGERLLEPVPVWKLPALDGVPAPPWSAAQLAKQVAKTVGLVLLWVVFSVVVAIVFVALAEGITGGGSSGKTKRIKGPGVVLRGSGAGSMMARLVTPALRRKGWWVLTDRRLAFVAVGRSYTKFWSGSGPETKIDGPVPLETVLEIPRDRYTYDEDHRFRKTRILRRTKPAGLYRRISLADGSGVDLRRRHQ